MGSLSILPVRTRRELKRFVKVPFHLHRNSPQWVAPLIFERMEFLNREKNPYFEHAEAEYFLAERDGEPGGQPSALAGQAWDESEGDRERIYGFLEAVDDPGVAKALFAAPEEWIRSRGRER